ncbi:MAG: hypothetical protein ACRELE_01130 [Gemmatimonadales bacterium]
MGYLYENRREPLLSRRKFAYRMWQHFLVALAVVMVSLVIGILGYHVLAGFRWVDSFLNAAMLLGGMGPVGDIPTVSGKLFAGIFALYAGLVLIVSTAVLLTPVLHRVMHRLHLEGRDAPKG